ncbi:MAG: hypothetical protein K6G15_02265 [Desulfovibrio sp.]|nr:hypothetical protein [Desulfovibrio sp.]
MPLQKLLLLLLLLLLMQPVAQASPPCPEPSPWLAQLSAQERLEAIADLAKAENELNVLRGLLRKKMAELRLLRYDRQSSPETLPRLGRELMELRERLRKAQMALQHHLCERFGSMPSLDELPSLLRGATAQ